MYCIETSQNIGLDLQKIRHRNYWNKACLVVKMMAEKGVSIAPELIYRLTEETTSKLSSSAWARFVLQALPESKLITKQVVVMDIVVQLAILQLTESGKILARQMGVELIESEYERIVRLHDGANQPKHTAQVLFTAYQARLRGLQAKVMPFEKGSGKPWYQPDLEIVDGSLSYSVEVETHSRNKPEKWVYKREANIVLPNPKVREWVVNRLRKLGIPGRATDLQTLARLARHKNLESFWLEQW